MAYYIGIAGGHRRSIGLVSEESRIVAVSEGSSLSLQSAHHLHVAEMLNDILQKLAAKLSVPSVAELRERTKRLVLALPDGMHPAYRALAEYCLTFNDWEDRRQWKIIDGMCASLVGGLLKHRGVCAYAGTTAAVYVGYSNELKCRPYKLDGRGVILGGFGSAISLAMEMLRFFGRASDRDCVPALFKDLCMQEQDIDNIDNIPIWFNKRQIGEPNDWHPHLAGIAAVATRAADRESPDPDASALVRGAAEGMAQTITIALERFAEASNLPIVFQGGMFEYSDLFRNTVSEIIKESYSNEIGYSAFRPVVGSLLMAHTEDGIVPEQVTIQAITNDIQNSEELTELLIPRPTRMFTNHPAVETRTEKDDP
jgi:N-acetylglucosamine kinase-like BadF-type ATPase